MNGEGDFSVYGEAKSEYTRQLCVFLVPTLETYMLQVLDTAREEAPTPNKVLWQFQTILQGIPDWNQEKVLRETDKLQKDCPCDYLEELITAVFIAHTKVLSSIRLTTKQKKLQITIPKIDHFLHRVLSDCARTLWTNAYLFADSNSIEKQKNLRQVSSLINDSVLQAIRALLPVKSILREYLHEDDVEDEKPANVLSELNSSSSVASSSVVLPAPTNVEEEKAVAAEAAAAAVAEAEAEETVEKKALAAAEAEAVAEAVVTEEKKAVEAVEAAVVTEEKTVEAPTPTSNVLTLVPSSVASSAADAEAEEKPTPKIINIDTKPSVTFSNSHVLFDSNTLEENGIQDIPFADEDITYFEESDELLPMEFDETL